MAAREIETWIDSLSPIVGSSPVDGLSILGICWHGVAGVDFLHIVATNEGCRYYHQYV